MAIKPNVNLSKTTVLQTADNYRLGYEAEACETLMSFIEELNGHLGSIPPQTLIELTNCMQLTLEAQARQDVISVADQLEYEILPKLLMAGLLID